jgi:DNA-binding protein HU-beta
VNKSDLIDRLAELMDGDKKSAQTAVESSIDAIQREVQKDQNVTIAGFGVVEKRSGPPAPPAIPGPASGSG